MSSEYEGLYDPDILHAYLEVRQWSEIPIDLFVSEFWDKGHSEHIGAALKASQTTPYDGSETPLEDYRKKMERIAISKVSSLLSNKSHDDCKETMRERKFILDSIVSSLAKMPGCQEPIAFLRSQGISEPEKHHMQSCVEISQAISAIWDSYKEKRRKGHDAEKFRAFFAANMKNSAELVEERKARKREALSNPAPGLKPAGVDSDMPALRRVGLFTSADTGEKSPSVADASFDDMPPLRQVSQKSTARFDDMPALRDVGTTISYDDMPALRNVAGGDVSDTSPYLADSEDDDLPPLEDRSTHELGFDDEDAHADMPPLRTAAPYRKVGSPQNIASGMPQLRASPVQRLKAATPQDTSTDMPLLRPRGTGSKTQESSSSSSKLTAVSWMEQYIQKNKTKLGAKNYIYFSPSNQRTHRVLKSIQVNAARLRDENGKEKSFNPDSFVATHLCPDFEPKGDIGNNAFKPLRDDGKYLVLVSGDRKIERPAVMNTSLTEDATVSVAGISVRVFVHENIFNFSK